MNDADLLSHSSADDKLLPSVSGQIPGSHIHRQHRNLVTPVRYLIQINGLIFYQLPALRMITIEKHTVILVYAGYLRHGNTDNQIFRIILLQISGRQAYHRRHRFSVILFGVGFYRLSRLRLELRYADGFPERQPVIGGFINLHGIIRIIDGYFIHSISVVIPRRDFKERIKLLIVPAALLIQRRRTAEGYCAGTYGLIRRFKL